MDIKAIVLGEITNHIEASMPTVKNGIEEYMIEKIQSEEVEKEWATAINEKINLPWLNEEQEQKVFEEVLDKGTDILAAVLRKVIK